MAENNGGLYAVLIAAFVVVVGGGLFVLGVFDSEPAGAEVGDLTSGTLTTGSERRPPPQPGNDSAAPPVSVQAREFRPDEVSDTSSVNMTTRGPALMGEVVSASGRPVVGAEVALHIDVSAIKSRPQEGPLHAATKTDQNGRFAIGGLDGIERYVLEVRHDDHASERVFPVELAQRGSLRQRIVLRSGIGLFGVVKDRQGLPIAGVEVTAYDLLQQSRDPEGQTERKAVTGADGEYRLEHLVAGTKRLVARKKGYGSSGRDHVEVRAGVEIAPQNFVMGEGYRLTGVVRDERTGLAVHEATLTVRPASGRVRRPPVTPGRVERDDRGEVKRPAAPAPRRSAFLIEQTRSDEQGAFDFDGLEKIRYHVVVQAEGYQPKMGMQAMAGEDEPLQIELVPSARISGRVIDAQTGEAIPSFLAMASPAESLDYLPAQQRRRYEDENGSFTCVDVKPGQVYVYAQAEGYAMGRSDPVTVEAGVQTEGMIIRLEKGTTLRGRVLGSDGKGVAGATVSTRRIKNTGGDPQAQLFLSFLQQQVRGSSQTAVTDGRGHYTLANLAGGRYELSASHPRYAIRDKHTVDCPAGVEEVIAPDFAAIKGGTIQGTVRNEKGDGPEVGATVMIRPTNAALGTFAPPRSVTTDASGAYRAEGLNPGTYSVIVSMRNNQVQIGILLTGKMGREVSVGDGETVQVDL